MANIQDLKFLICQVLFRIEHWWYLKLNRFSPENTSSTVHTGLWVDVLQKMDRKEQKSPFFFQVFFSALSSLSSSSQRGKVASPHRRAVMWFQCLGPCGTVPLGGKPLRLCWHITTPIINSRSALSFLLHLSSFLLTAAFFCYTCALHRTPSPSTHFFLIFCLNNHTFLSALKYLLYSAQPGFGQETPLNGRILDSGDDETGEDVMIQLICRRLSLKHCNPQENYTTTFKLGVSNQKTSRIDFLLPTFTSQVSSSSIPFLFHWLIFVFLSSVIPVTFYLVQQPSSSFSHFSLLFICAATFYLICI